MIFYSSIELLQTIFSLTSQAPNDIIKLYGLCFIECIRRKDNDIRGALVNNLPFLYDNPENIKIIHELGILQGNARVDVAVIDDYLHGYEIKSDNDTLQRLPQQADSYNKVFDTMTLIISYKYKLNKIEFLPEWWGV